LTESGVMGYYFPVWQSHSRESDMLVAQGTSTVHYYLYEYTDEEGNPHAVIFEDYSVDSESPGPEFVEVTIEQLHQRGYLTASERLAQTPNATIDTHTYGGFKAESWFVGWIDQRTGKKKYDSGGKTTRPNLGELYLDMWYKIVNAQGVQVNLLDPPPIIRHQSDSIAWHHTAGHGAGTTHSHFIKGEHEFQLPPEAIIQSHVEAQW